ncbi:right-handed parallel beta-helix repeat-containing protein [bacterium]|nr:right-handed parallel beta-helix repeat-containing protein [bacterium]
MIRKLLLLSVITLCLASHSDATEYVSGPQSGVWSYSEEPYIVYGDISVNAGTTLTIEPGVRVWFMGDLINFEIQGTLIAEGTETIHISFTPYLPTYTSWQYLYFNGFFANNSSLRWCDFSQGIRGVTLDQASISIAHCTFTDCQWQGFYSNNSSFTFDSCTVQYCGSGAGSSGIVAKNGSPHIRGNIVTYNADRGMYLKWLSNGEVTYNECTYNGTDGFFIDSCNTAVIKYNTAAFNLNNGIYIDNSGLGYSPVDISYNLIYGNCYNGIRAWYSGIMIINNTIHMNGTANMYDGLTMYETNATIYNNIIDSNANYGIYALASSAPAMGYNNVWANTVDYFGIAASLTDLSEDPLYEDPASFNFNLQDISPMIDAGNPSTAYYDPDGTRNDIGALYYNQTSVKDRWIINPERLALLRAYPNPFNSGTFIELTGFTGDIASIEIFDILGRKVYNYEITAGNPAVLRWNGMDFKGNTLPAGIYFCRAGEAPVLKLQMLK